MTPSQRLIQALSEAEEIIRNVKRKIGGPKPRDTLRKSKHCVKLSIDGRDVWLPDTLARLYQALDASAGKWITAEQLREQLGVDGRHRTHQAIVTAVWRLRKHLRQDDLDGRIKTCRNPCRWRWDNPDRS